MLAQAVDARHPVDIHRVLLLLGIFTAVALDLDDEVQQILVALAIVHAHDEVGPVLAHLGLVAVRHFEPKVVVLHVGTHTGVRFGHAAELGFPVTVEHHPIDVAATGISLIALGLGGVEADMLGAAGRVVRVEHHLDGAVLGQLGAHDAGSDAFTGGVGQGLVLQLCREGSTLADQVPFVEPLLDDALELAEQVQLGRLAWVAPLVENEEAREFVDHLRGADIGCMRQRQIDRLTDDAAVARFGSAHQFRR